MQCLHSQYYAAFEFTVEQFRQGSIYMHGTMSRRYVSFNNCNVFFLTRRRLVVKEFTIHHTVIFHLHEFRFLMCRIHAIRVAFYRSVSSIDKKTKRASRRDSYHIKVVHIFNLKSARLLWMFSNARNK